MDTIIQAVILAVLSNVPIFRDGIVADLQMYLMSSAFDVTAAMLADILLVNIRS